MLEVKNINVKYGEARALSDVSIDIAQQELISVIGPNGAGKTTLVNTIMGLNRTSGGEIFWEGVPISKIPAHSLCERGLALVPESRRLFTNMSVLENLELGAMYPAAKSRRSDSIERVCTLFPAVRLKLGQLAGTLSGGQQQMVAIGRALMALPRLLLLDEPSLGLAPSIVKEMFLAIQKIHSAGTAVLLIEQNVSKALAISQRAYVLENGQILMSGSGGELSENAQIKKAYLGL